MYHIVFSLVCCGLGFSSLEVKYDIFKYGDEGTWQKHPDKYSQHKIVDPYLSSMSWTSYSRKKPSRWMNISTHTHTAVPKIHKKSSKFLLNFSEFCNSDTSRGDCFASVFLEIFRECF